VSTGVETTGQKLSFKLNRQAWVPSWRCTVHRADLLKGRQLRQGNFASVGHNSDHVLSHFLLSKKESVHSLRPIISLVFRLPLPFSEPAGLVKPKV